MSLRALLNSVRVLSPRGKVAFGFGGPGLRRNSYRIASVPLGGTAPSYKLVGHHSLRSNQSVAVSVGRLASVHFSEYTATKVRMPESKPFERLPDFAKPKHYSLSLRPDLKSFEFSGDVNVEVEVVKPTDKLVLNALDLKVNKASLTGQDGVFDPSKIDLSTENETVTFTFPSTLQPGTYNLGINFNGEINDKMKGLYRSKYPNENGTIVYAAVTQFEPTDARRCFPCWDEPALKATFDITLTVPEKLVALSNMPVRSSSKKGEYVEYTFDRTPIMSTYLVAAVVGEYDYIEDTSKDGVLVRVYTPKGKTEQGRFALEVCTKVLPYYKDYFNIAYPLPKMDLIAIADFSAGAMENWGLVTYREAALLVDSANTAANRKQYVALVVGHELAHQWFGNLVTMEWWTHLWLNEGYASFVEFLCVNHLFPEYDIWTQFVNDMYIPGLQLDCLKNSHPIEVNVGHPSEIDEIFDDISYNKGASVIRMLHHYLGDENFRKGMNLYLTRHQYKNTFTEDLWAALEETSKKPVGAVMSTWTKQMGFPMVSVSKSSSGDGTVKLSLKQEKFCADGRKDDSNSKWMIPISVATSKDPKQEVASTVLEGSEGELHIPTVDTDWIKINPGTIGFYRTKYPSDMLESFLPAIKDKSMPPLDRLGLVDDLFAMVKAGHTSTVEVLKFLIAYENEDDFTVWATITNILGRLGILMSYTESQENFNRYQQVLLRKIYETLGWDLKPNESHLNTMLRGIILARMAILGDKAFEEEAKIRFDKHSSASAILPADIRSACYKAVLRCNYPNAYETLLKMYRSADLQEEKDRISRSLGSSQDPEILKEVLKFAISDEVRAQDTVFVIISVALTPAGRDLAWDFFKANYKELIDRYQGGFLVSRLIKYTTENFASADKAEEVTAFFKDNKCPGAERTLQQSIESIHLNASWLERDAAGIKEYLKSF